MNAQKEENKKTGRKRGIITWEYVRLQLDISMRFVISRLSNLSE